MKANIQHGLKENWKQFSLLVLINAFVGGMLGMERSIFPEFAESYFGLTSTSAMLSFITAFGISKALANYYTGKLANRFGRKNLLVLGWLIALPVPFILITANHWNWVVFANVLLGIGQGFTWSSTVVMKIDLVGERDRGFAMGLNEFSGYFALGLSALLAGYVADVYGIRPYPFYIGIVLSILGVVCSFFWVKDTRAFVEKEGANNKTLAMQKVFLETTFKNKTLSAITQAGLVNNLNDGMIWGLLPVFLLALHYDTDNIALIAGIYPSVWGIAQLFTGKMSDHYSKKKMLFGGMMLQGLAIIFIPSTTDFHILCASSATLGLGTALVYPTFLSSIAQVSRPEQRAETIGTFRLWRDLGYAFGAIASGILADVFGINVAIYFIGILTVLSSITIGIRMPKDLNLKSMKTN